MQTAFGPSFAHRQSHNWWNKRRRAGVVARLSQLIATRLRLALVLMGMHTVTELSAAGQSTPLTEQTFQAAAMRVQPKRWDKEHNFESLSRFAHQAAAAKVQLLVSCEGFLDGYTGNASHAPDLTHEKYLAVGETIDGPWMKRIAGLAKECQLYLSVGFAERREQRMFNSVAIYSPEGKLVLHYSKTHTSGEAFNTPGATFPVTQTGLGKLGALICFDRLFPEVPRILALKGAQVLVVPAYGSDGELNEALLRTRAWENSVWLVYAKQDQALIINPSGTIVARDGGAGDELVIAEIELKGKMGEGSILHRRSPEIYRELIELDPPRKP
jgi:predicted amidohydrolase